jgi:glyoxylase-like metal-dependent hydrolase (beta-lactamase superfamily II)
MLETTVLPVTAFQQNCTLVVCSTSKKAVLTDPGGDLVMLKQAVTDSGATIEKILLTHGHLDHCAAARVLADHYGVPIEGPHIADDFWIQQLVSHSAQYGLENWGIFTPNRWLKDGDTVTIGDTQLDVLHCPGHTPGHVVFVSKADRLAWVGDVIFAGSIGRTDFPRGNHADLIASIRNKLFPLGDDITFVCGHGPDSTFGRERASNPYVADHLFA